MATYVKLSRCQQAITRIGLLVSALGTVTAVAQSRAIAQPTLGDPAQGLKSRSSFATRNTPTQYYFTVHIPETAQPLKTIKIQQILGVDTITFQQDESKAFLGRSNQGTPLSLDAVGGAGEEDTLTVAFAQPIQPGSNVTITARPRLNPDTDGVYLFRLKGFTADASDPGQSLGMGRIHVNSD
ncbi:DUF2808 domain-containing protein [Acaryochloris sp. IP29b_bin.137]|uniref:DUF2808 domain-containing protein n=1 Tax=Acaryochloris sp. IP29b_bin.137 TaxID=2969217 RepID=UPI0026289B48|nr:DUF2808 domain-containing protein [Acaryochloris sp. IP29b_bin.137]